MDSMNADVTYFTLSNGMRGVHLSHAAGSVDYFGVCVNIGSRDETVAEHGLAHFVEHTIFKGTRRRRSWHILNRMERVGGELNAFTTKEETVVYTIAPCGHLDRAAELIADLMQGVVAHDLKPRLFSRYMTVTVNTPDPDHMQAEIATPQAIAVSSEIFNA